MLCSMQCCSLERRKCKVKLDPVELEMLVDEANKHLNELQQISLTVTQRNAIWEKIHFEKVNAVGKMMRTTVAGRCKPTLQNVKHFYKA